MPPRLVFASHNSHKRDEVWAILEPLLPGWTSADLATARDFDVPSPAEDGVTFAENALIKARAVCAATGLPAVADDSGIAVNVMGGAPGIFSALWSGVHGADEDNVRLLLAQLVDIPDAHRAAAFVCAAALVTPGGHEVVCEGRMEGSIVREAAGAGGFGYDPIFIPTGHEVTAAELSAAQKNAISHRGQAFAAIAPHLERL
ncbi:RdgB/HAM1 family non-canonical purine NTP pyrophosphatase [Demequina sp. TMPB413]|uniref:RdgB/HAM1 family non-canonical purine NTP pyrophosphatase n=1 Tax=Demequina sp. TMPB413 TaxID=2881056 RepID=UPI001CF4ADEC|nr:RdgB/HAM1 family non-canonical purine NTP pyrophosphatase [Demequina sp. TMPB413]UPU87183.1 RdgB/HAM1 family non-canonical purine NTP pyrophosphatase [Demequina sp. TMPB413]